MFCPPHVCCCCVRYVQCIMYSLCLHEQKAYRTMFISHARYHIEFSKHTEKMTVTATVANIHIHCVLGKCCYTHYTRYIYKQVELVCADMLKQVYMMR